MKKEILSDTEIKKLTEYFNQTDHLLLGMGRESLIQERNNKATFCLHVVPETILGPQKAVILVPKDVSIYCLESSSNTLWLIMSDSDSDMMLTKFLALFPDHRYMASLKPSNEEGLIDGMDTVSVSTPASYSESAKE